MFRRASSKYTIPNHHRNREILPSESRHDHDEDHHQSMHDIPFNCYEIQRNYTVFPTGVGVNGPYKHQSPMSYTPDNLLERFLQYPTERVEDLLVTSMQYLKVKKNPRHEFILIEVSDIQQPGRLKNYLVLDRTSTGAGSSAKKATAQDTFRISYDGQQSSLIDYCGLSSNKELAATPFDPATNPLPLYQLVILAKYTSETRTVYDPRNHNCYWFAYSVWQCVRRLYPSIQQATNSERGKLYGVRFHSTTNHIDNIMSKYALECDRFALHLSRNKQVRIIFQKHFQTHLF